MKISINQPYFFPYLPYFQLINCSNVFVNLDHVQYVKRSYITRNTLKNNIDINIPVIGGSQTKSCREVYADCTDKWWNKFSKTLDLLYKNETNYCIILDEVLSPWYRDVQCAEGWGKLSISEFNLYSIELICDYLDIKTSIAHTSENLTSRKRNEGLQDIVRHLGGDQYINAIGGQKLYSKNDFKNNGIELNFLKNKSTLPTTSILDLLFRFDKEQIKEELNKYELI